MSLSGGGPIAIALHGGCGVLAPDELSEAEWAAARADIAAALRAGWSILRRGGRALDAVEACVLVLEDSPHLNAGHGAALNRAGDHELDAAIMDGANGAAGAVCAAHDQKPGPRSARGDGAGQRGPARRDSGRSFRRDRRPRRRRSILLYHAAPDRVACHDTGATAERRSPGRDRGRATWNSWRRGTG